MTGTISQIALLVGKDLRIEGRNRQAIGLVVVLGLLIVVVLGLGLGPQNLSSGASAVTTLWVAYLFGGVLCFEKTMAVERQDGALASLLLSPVDRGVLHAAKLIVNLLLMLVLALVVTPVAVVFFNLDLSRAPFAFTAVMALSMLGFAAVGTLFAFIASSSRLQGGLLAMVIFPIALPLVIASTQLLLKLFSEQKTWDRSGLLVLVAFDAIYLTVSWIVFEVALEP